MTSSMNYKDTLFKKSNLTPIREEPTFETLHNIWNDIKENPKSVYYILVVGVHGHLYLVLNDTHCTLISPTPFVYPTHSGLLIVLDGTTVHINYNMHIVHTKKVRLFRKVTGVEQALVQQIIDMVKEAYITNIRNRTKNKSKTPWRTC